MTTPDPVARLAARLTAIDWTPPYGQNRRSRARLMSEYLRRAALWTQELHCQEWPFPDFAAYIDPVVRADPDTVARVRTTVDHWWPWIGQTLEHMLHWAALTANAGRVLPDLPDPYEPLLVFFERGGEYTLDGTGFIEVGGLAVRRKTWQENLAADPIVALDAATLDTLDSSDG